jgi:Sec7-like guanine-nucleotide exchange factor
MRDFDFEPDALDVALRKLLMGVSLPKETQQIDRVMEAFAKRYDECHPGLLKDPGTHDKNTLQIRSLC